MSKMQWPAWGTEVTVQVTDPATLRGAHRLVAAALARAESVADLRNPHAEVHRIDGADGRPVRVTPLLASLIRNAVASARITDGLLDPTVGAAVVRYEAVQSGIDRRKDLALLPVCGGIGLPAPRTAARPLPGWDSIVLDGRRVTVPAGTLLDLSATAKAAAARYCAWLVWQRLGVGVLVDLGGDVVTAGPAPAGGWPAIDPGFGDELRLPGGAALARVRRPMADPVSGLVADGVWACVTVSAIGLAGGVAEAKALAVAGKLLGPEAPGWLEARRAQAVLVDRTGIRMTTRLMAATG